MIQQGERNKTAELLASCKDPKNPIPTKELKAEKVQTDDQLSSYLDNGKSVHS